MADEVCGAFGWQPFGQDSQYGKSFCGTSPFLANQSPAPGSSGNPANSNIYLEVGDNEDDLDEATVEIYINAVLAWSTNTVRPPGFSGTKVRVPYGYGYTLSLWENFDPGYQNIRVVAYDVEGRVLDETYYFSTNAPASICPTVQWGSFQWGQTQWGEVWDCTEIDCFEGPLNAFEQSLLVPYDGAGTTLYHMEILRSSLLRSANTEPHFNRSMRRLFLLAFDGDLFSILRDLVPTPTTRERSAKLCNKRTIIQMDADLRGKPGLLQGALSELSAQGLTTPHYQMLRRYLATDEPNTVVPLACFMMVLAKALEENALT